MGGGQMSALSSAPKGQGSNHAFSMHVQCAGSAWCTCIYF